MPSAHPFPKTILFYGDSNSFGTKPLVKPNVLERYGMDKRWISLVRKALQDKAHIIEEALPSRTTVHDDPISGADKNGLTYLRPCLYSHLPLDIIVLMLGTNDLKVRFSVTPDDIANSIERLIEEIQFCKAGPNGTMPKLVLLSPAPILETGVFIETFAGGAEKSRQLASRYQEIARKHDAIFLDIGTIVQVSPVDGIHFDEDQLPLLANAIIKLLRPLL